MDKKELIATIIFFSIIAIPFTWIAMQPMENKIKKPQEIIVVTDETSTEWQKEIPEVAPVQQELVQQSTEESTEEENIPYSKEEYELLAHIMQAEAGAPYMSDEAIYLVGAVVMNRVKSDDFPNTIYDVVFQKGQYSPTWNGGLYKYEPSERVWKIAESILMNGTEDVPEHVLYQAEFVQGRVFKYIDGMYFCYKD